MMTTRYKSTNIQRRNQFFSELCHTLLILAELQEHYNIIVEFLSTVVPATGANAIRLLFVTELFPPSARTVVGQAMLFGSMAVGMPVVSLFPIINSIFSPIFFVPFVIVQTVFGIYLYRYMPETRGRAVYDIIESMDKDVASRAVSIDEENTPLIKNRARTLATKRNSILNTPRTRAMTFDHKFISENCT